MDLIKVGIEKMLFPYMEARRGNQIRRYTAELEETAKLSKAELLRLQSERLTALLLHCAEKVPAYSGLNGREDEIKANPYKALTDLVPVLGKQTFKGNPDIYLADGYTDAQRILNHTGGSTAEPMNFYMDRRQVEHYEAARWRGLSWHGISYGSRSVMVWGNQYELSQQEQAKAARKEKLLKNRQMISCFAMKPADVENYIRLLNDYKPEYLYGYSSGLATLAQMIKDCHKAGEASKTAADYGLRLKLKAIVATSETLFPWQKELIEEVFGTAVVCEYGARDAGILSYGCSCGGNHLSVENAVFEVLDPISLEPVKPGTPGVLAVTDLWNYVQPRLRYLLGDTVVLKEEEDSCPCGCNLPMLASIEGREDAILIAEDGTLVHGDIVCQTLRDFIIVKNGRFIQHSREQATLMLAFNSGNAEVLTDEELQTADTIIERLKICLGSIDIKAEFVPEIKPSASGKMRYSIREFSLK